MIKTQKGKALLAPSLAPSNKLFVILLLVLALAGCSITPQATQTTSNPAARVEKLFEHDDCTVYRFTDIGQYVYYVTCKDGSAQTSWEHHVGKTSYLKQVHTEKQKNGRLPKPVAQSVGHLSHPITFAKDQDVQEYYDYLNFQFYNSDLPRASVRFVPNLQVPDEVTGTSQPAIAVTIPTNPPQILIDAGMQKYPPAAFLYLVHEQCHVSTDKFHPESEDHGPNFQTCMFTMAAKGALAQLW